MEDPVLIILYWGYYSTKSRNTPMKNNCFSKIGSGKHPLPAGSVIYSQSFRKRWERKWGIPFSG